MNSTARIHANFSLPLVLLENRMAIKGSNQTEPIKNIMIISADDVSMFLNF